MNSTWHYRIVRYADGGYGLHEVYCYGETPHSWTTEPIGFVADEEEEEGPEAVIRALRMALRDAECRPVLQLKETWAELHGVEPSHGTPHIPGSEAEEIL